jgi:hypothetical protein
MTHGGDCSPCLKWQRRRALFNHDWLKNRYLLALETYLNILAGLVDNPGLEATYIDNILPEWELYSPEGIALIREFKTYMSPAVLFKMLPLRNCEPRERELLATLVDARWRERYPIATWTAEAQASWRGVQEAYRVLRCQIELCGLPRNTGALRPLAGYFEDYRTACRRIARSIELLPGTLRVT